MNRIKGAISFTKRFKLVSFCIALITLFLPSAYGFTPQPGSPLASRSHPRLHITENTLPGQKPTLTGLGREVYDTLKANGAYPK